MPKSMTLTFNVTYGHLEALNDAIQRLTNEYGNDYSFVKESSSLRLSFVDMVIKVEAKKPGGDPYWDGDFIRRMYQEIRDVQVSGMMMQEVIQDENCIQVVGDQ